MRLGISRAKIWGGGGSEALYIHRWHTPTERGVNKKSPGWYYTGPGKIFVRGFRLAAIRDRDRFVHVMVGAIDMPNHAVSQSARFGIVFFFLDIAMRLVQKLAGIMQTPDPGIVRVNRRAVRNVLAVVECGTLDFVDGVVDFFDGGALFSVQRASVGALQMCPRIPQVGKSVQVGRMLALRARVL